jgi:hypothetical protein
MPRRFEEQTMMLSRACVLGLLLSACGVERLDAGSTASTDAGEAAREKALWPLGPPSNSFNLPCTLPAPPELAGMWQGQFDSHQLASGSSAIRIDVGGAYEAAGGLCGTVTFGEGTAPPLATDPEAPAPGEPQSPSATLLAGVTLLEGFPYEFHAAGRQPVFKDTLPDGGLPSRLVDAGLTPGAVEGNQVSFGITLRQPLKSWCNLQFSYLLANYEASASQNLLLGGPQTNCIPLTALVDDGSRGTFCSGVGTNVQGVSCQQATYCVMRACNCVVSSIDNRSPPHGCTVLPASETRFSLTLDGSVLSGTVNLASAGLQPVHFTRAQ